LRSKETKLVSKLVIDVKHLNISLSEDEYEKLSEYKEQHGLTWKEVLKEAPDGS
jgi:extradiol dioxygenase family protein